MLSNALNERPHFSHIIFFFLLVKCRTEFKILLLSYTILNNQAFLLWNQKMILETCTLESFVWNHK